MIEVNVDGFTIQMTPEEFECWVDELALEDFDVYDLQHDIVSGDFLDDCGF